MNTKSSWLKWDHQVRSIKIKLRSSKIELKSSVFSSEIKWESIKIKRDYSEFNRIKVRWSVTQLKLRSSEIIWYIMCYQARTTDIEERTLRPSKIQLRLSDINIHQLRFNWDLKRFKWKTCITSLGQLQTTKPINFLNGTTIKLYNFKMTKMVWNEYFLEFRQI